MARTFKHLETKAVHAGVPSPRIGGAVIMPIFQSAMFEYAGETNYHDLKYIRLNNTPSTATTMIKTIGIKRKRVFMATSSIRTIAADHSAPAGPA